MAENKTCAEAGLPQQIRVSLGTAIVLGLLEGKLNAEPTAAYFMTYKAGKCTANCGFCPQARSSNSRAELLSRVTWPKSPTISVLRKLGVSVKKGKIRRVCIQALNYTEVISHLISLITAIRKHAKAPVSVSCQPLNRENMHCLAAAGAERIGIALDTATEKLFEQVKGEGADGPYRWESQFRQLRMAVEVFGKGKVSTHLIVGLGETENQAVSLIQRCVDMDVLPALFAFTPVLGTKLEMKPQPRIEGYRRIQLARYLIVNGYARSEDMHFNGSGCLIDYGVGEKSLKWIVETGVPFLTSGCPNCNRPFYNEKPSGPIYNYPKKIHQTELTEIKQQLSLKANC